MHNRRRPVNKGKSVRKFKKEAGKTQVANVSRPGRGGFRL